jgi:hypothetical protein
MLIYATPDDLAEWWGKPAPDNAVSLLRAASNLVARETRTAFYAVQPSGLPKEPDVVEAFRDAVTSQAAYWASNNLDPTKGAVSEAGSSAVIGKKIKGAEINYSVSLLENNRQARATAFSGLCDEAWTILNVASLVNQQPWSAG